ncbi:hypothetical protein FQR65_LT00419 [Abscondita terminalis]|nr:hypothetical protein FQR65_LT00419 [Abscondita terminalis]
MKRKWRVRNKKKREQQKALQNILINTPASTPPPSSPRLFPLSPRSRSLTPVLSTSSERGRLLPLTPRSCSLIQALSTASARSCKNGVDEDGDVRVMFYKTVDGTGKLFKLVESDVSDVMFANLLKIVSTPKEVIRERRIYYEFD